MTDDSYTDLERRIVERLEGSKRPQMTLGRLARGVAADPEELDRALASLESRGEILRRAKGRVLLTERAGLATGTVRVGRGGRAVVVPDIPDAPLRLSRHGARPALDGDRVLVEVSAYTHRGLRSATIKRIIERHRTSLVCVVSKDRPHRLLPMDRRLDAYVLALGEDSVLPEPGRVVAARILEYPTATRDLVVHVEEELGAAGKLPTEIRAVCRSMGLPVAFPEDVVGEADDLSEPTQAELDGRTDLRADLTFTIDPADAQDHDDAVSIAETSEGFRLTVSIADVANYVRPGSKLDREAFERGTSTYFPGRTVPMLPERISGNLASLRPDVDRLALSVFLDIDRDGRVVATDFSRTVIRSDARLSYQQVQRTLDGEETSDVDPQVHRALALMAGCAEKLLERRLERGAIDMDLPEIEVEVDAGGQPAALRRRPRLFAHRIVEEFMLAANEAVAEHLERRSAPFLYRIHEKPEGSSLVELGSRMRALGLRLARDGSSVTPQALQKILQTAAGTDTARQVNLMVLRSMTRACYSAEKEIHFGLASTSYTHFTSPIRRYPDLVVHRALTDEIAGKRATVPGGENSTVPPAEQLRTVARQCSDRERRAADAERDILRAAAVIYLQPHVGEVFTGTVSSVERSGFRVEIDGTGIEGFVHVGRLTEYYEYVSERMELVSRVSNACIAIGQRMEVRLASLDLAGRSIDMEPV